MVRALAALLLCQLAGELASRGLGLPVPGPVLGAALLVAAMIRLGRVPGDLRVTSRALLTYLALLFVPAGTGIIVHLDRVRDEWLPIAAALVVSTVVTIAATAFCFQFLSRRMGLSDEGRE